MNWVDETLDEVNEIQDTPTDANLAEAFRELGALRRENALLKKHVESTKTWVEEAKERAGYDQSVSFDQVFDDLLRNKKGR